MATATMTMTRSRSHGSRRERHEPLNLLDVPPVSTVFRGEKAFFHTRCRRPIQFQGSRGGNLEGDFYCLACQEHVTLPAFMLDRIPYVAEQ